MDTLRAAHVAKLLGVSHERVRQIAQRDPTFPQPVATEPHRRWDRAEVERWAERYWWGTRPWRTPTTD
ncbi:MAG: helix-turn-helix transcriptional regulator [Actinomycetota bacterium]